MRTLASLSRASLRRPASASTWSCCCSVMSSREAITPIGRPPGSSTRTYEHDHTRSWTGSAGVRPVRRRSSSGSPVARTSRIASSMSSAFTSGRTCARRRPTCEDSERPFITSRAGLTCRNRSCVSRIAMPTGERANSPSQTADDPRIRRAAWASAAKTRTAEAPWRRPGTGLAQISSSSGCPSWCQAVTVPITPRPVTAVSHSARPRLRSAPGWRRSAMCRPTICGGV